MYNLIKSELYKLRYGQTYRGLFALAICCVMATMIASFNAETFHLELISTYLNDRLYGFVINTFSNPDKLKGIEFFASGLGWTPILVVGLMYLIGTFICEEYANGTYKTTLTYGHKRTNVYISKLLSISLGITILIFLVPFMALILGSIIHGWGKPFKIQDIIDMLKVLGTSTIVFISITSIFMFIGIIIKNKALIVALGILFLILPVLLLGNIPLEIIQYIPSFMLMDICRNIPSPDIINKIIMTCSVITIICTIFGCYIFKKQDIK